MKIDFISVTFHPGWIVTNEKLLTLTVNRMHATFSDLPMSLEVDDLKKNPNTIQNALIEVILRFSSRYVQVNIVDTSVSIDDERDTKFVYEIKQESMRIVSFYEVEKKSEELPIRVFCSQSAFILRDRREKEMVFDVKVDFIELTTMVVFSRLVRDRSPIYIANLKVGSIVSNIYSGGILNHLLYKPKHEERQVTSIFDRPKTLFRVLPKEIKAAVESIKINVHLSDQKVLFSTGLISFQVDAISEREIVYNSRITQFVAALEKSKSRSIDIGVFQLDGKFDWTKHKKKLQVGPDIGANMYVSTPLFIISDKLIVTGNLLYKELVQLRKDLPEIKDPKVPIHVPLIDKLHLFGTAQIVDSKISLELKDENFVDFTIEALLFDLKQTLDEKVRYSSQLSFSKLECSFTHADPDLFSKNIFVESSTVSTEFDGRDMIDDIAVYVTISSFVSGYSSQHERSLSKSIEFVKFVQDELGVIPTPSKPDYIPKLLLKLEVRKIQVHLKHLDHFLIMKTSLDCLWNLPSWSNMIIFDRLVTNFIAKNTSATILSLGQVSVKCLGEQRCENVKITCNQNNFAYSSILLIQTVELFRQLSVFELFKSKSSSHPLETCISLSLSNLALKLRFSTTAQLEIVIPAVHTGDLSENFNMDRIAVSVNEENPVSIESLRIIMKRGQPTRKSDFLSLHEGHTQELSNNYGVEVRKPRIIFQHGSRLGHAIDLIQKSVRAIQITIGEAFDRRLPHPIQIPNILVRIITPRVEMQDSPIEKCLTMHMQIWPTEYSQRLQRENLLHSGIKNRNLPGKEIEKLKSELILQSEQVYLNNIKHFQSHTGRSRELFTIEAGVIEIHLRQPEWFQSREGLLKEVSKYDPTPVPTDENGASKLHDIHGVSVEVFCVDVSLSMRNFPLPFMKMDEFQGIGNVILGQFRTSPENCVFQSVDLGNGEIMNVPMTILPLYKYYRGKINLLNADISVGTGMDPAFADIGIFSNTLSPKEIDPSKPNNWWDTMRRTCHGDYEVTVRNCRLRMLWGVNCYDQTDYIDCSIGFLNGSGSRSNYKIFIHNMFVKQNPNLSSFANNMEFPLVEISLEYLWKCKGDPYGHYFPIDIPLDCRIESYVRGSGEYDSYENWRSSEVNCIFKAEIDSDASNTGTSPTIMYDPLSTSWFLKFIKFMENEPLEIYLGKVRKYMIPKRKEYDVMDFIKSFQLQISSRNTHIVWSNGVEDNNLLHIEIGFMKFYAYLFRYHLPEIYKCKRKREKREMKSVKMVANANELTVLVHSYDEEKKKATGMSFGRDYFGTIKDVAFLQNVVKTAFPNVMQGYESSVINNVPSGYENQLLVREMKCLWNPVLRDAVLIWADVAQQYAFNEMEIMQRFTLKKIEKQSKSPLNPLIDKSDGNSEIEGQIAYENDILKHLLSKEVTEKKQMDPKNQTIHDMFCVVLERAQVVLVAEETEECMIFAAEKGQVEVRKIVDNTNATSPVKYTEIISLMEKMRGYVAKTTDNLADTWTGSGSVSKSSKIIQVMDKSDWVITVNIFDVPQPGKPLKTLNIDVPFMKLKFSSSHLQTLIDVITNSLIPKKMVRTVTLEDQFSTMLYKSKLNPESWGNTGVVLQKCEQTRKEVRRLESQMGILQREASKNMTQKVIDMIQECEVKLAEQKALYHAMKENLNANVNTILSKRQDEPTVDMMIRVVVHSMSYSMLDKHGKIFAEILFTLFKGVIIKNLDYSILHDFTLHHISAKNRLPNPIYEDMLMPYNELDDLTEESDYMLRICANKKPPIGGIGGFDHLEIDLSPLHLQITYELYRALWNYCFPLSKQEKHEEEVLNTEISTNATAQIKKIENAPPEKKPSFLDRFRRGSLKVESPIKSQESDIDEMKHRAKSTKIFNYVRVQEVQLYVSLMGVPESEDSLSRYVHNFEKLAIVLQPITYNQQIWTWQDFFENLKKDVLNQAVNFILPETVKSFTKNRLNGVLEMIKPLTSHAPTTPLEQTDSQGKIIKGAKKLKQAMVNLKETMKDEYIEDSKLKQMMLFGKNQQKDDVGKKMFGSHYEPKKPVPTDDLTSPRQEEVFDLYDIIKKETEEK